MNNQSTNWVWLGVIVLLVLHQDFWYWDDPTLVCGFLPIGLAYHALYTLVAACLWAGAVRCAWPSHLEKLATPVADDTDT